LVGVGVRWDGPGEGSRPFAYSSLLVSSAPPLAGRNCIQAMWDIFDARPVGAPGLAGCPTAARE